MARGTGTRLTDAAISKMTRPKAGTRREVFDTGQPGLAIRLTSRGGWSWVVYFRDADGRNCKRTLGTYPAVSLADARKRAHADKELAKAGGDPRREARLTAEREKAAEGGPPTFGEIAEKYIEMKEPKLARGADERRMIEITLLAKWHDRVFEKLRRRDPARIIDGIVTAGKLVVQI